MTDPDPGRQRGGALGPTNPRLLGNPLDFIAEDHWRERQVCAEMDLVATSGDATPELLTDILCFLIEELPLHLADEEQDLFPIMRQRCATEDEIDRVIAKLSADHVHAKADTDALAVSLRAALDTRTPISADVAAKLADFAGHARRHLVLENAIVLPIARKRLKPKDLDTMRANMMARRGLDRLVEGTQC